MWRWREHLNFNRAAEACNVSQPSLSKQIQKMEEYLGVLIFERSNRKVAVTPVGAAIIQHAQRALREAENIRQTALAARDPMAGDFRLGIIPTVAPYLLPRILAPIAKGLPKINLILREVTTLEAAAELRKGQLDAILIALPLEDDEFEEVLLYNEPFLLAVPNNHKLAKKNKIDPGDIASEHLLLLEDGHCLRSQALQVCSANRVQSESDFSATSLETLRQMVAAGHGVTLMPELAAEAVRAKITYIRFKSPAPSRAIGLVSRKTSPRRKLLEEMEQIIIHAMRDQPVKKLETVPIALH